MEPAFMSTTGLPVREPDVTDSEVGGPAIEDFEANDPIHKLQALIDDRIGGIHIDPELQPHPDHDAQQLAQTAMESLGQPGYDDSTDSPVVQNAAAAAAAAAANRSKTSRACDECRRKKIRCDGSSEMEMGACSSCKRSGHACAYSRTPQKRGPNRGYIRELTERVSLLERERHDGGQPIQSQQIAFLSATETASPSVAYAQVPLKRPVEDDSTLSVERVGIPPEARDAMSMINAEALTSYFTHIHPFLPLLPADVDELHRLLNGAGPGTLAAFTLALNLSQQDPLYLGTSSQNHTLAVRQASESFTSCRYDEPHSLLQVATGLLLLLDSTNRGASSMVARGEPTPWTILKETVDVAISNSAFEDTMNATSADETSVRRLSLSLTILDALMANANKKDSLMPTMYDAMTTPRPEDRPVHGRRLFELNRVTRVIRQVLEIDVNEVEMDGKELESTNNDGFDYPNAAVYSPRHILYLRRLKKAYADALTSVVLTYNYNEDNLVAMIFWYARVLIEVHFYPLAQAEALVHSLRTMLDIFVLENSVSLFTHHISGFMAHLLVQLVEFNELKDECIPLLDNLGETLNRIVPAHDTDSYDAAIKDAVNRKRQALGQSSSNLAQLANAAVGNDGADHGVAEAAAAAAQAALSGNQFSGARLSKDGYITGLLGAA